MKRFLVLTAIQICSSVSLIASADCGTIGGSSVPAPVTGVTAMTKLVQNDEKENLVADVYSRTLYTFDMDNGLVTSACNESCAEAWPPALLTEAEKKTLTAPLGAITRTNKTLQLTFEGKPVYTYAFDRHVGDDQGDGIGGVWHYIQIK